MQKQCYKKKKRKERDKQKQKTKTKNKKNAQRFIKNSVADSLTEITTLNTYFCHDDIIHHQTKVNHTERTKSVKNADSPYTLIDYKPPKMPFSLITRIL